MLDAEFYKVFQSFDESNYLFIKIDNCPSTGVKRVFCHEIDSKWIVYHPCDNRRSIKDDIIIPPENIDLFFLCDNNNEMNVIALLFIFQNSAIEHLEELKGDIRNSSKLTIFNDIYHEEYSDNYEINTILCMYNHKATKIFHINYCGFCNYTNIHLDDTKFLELDSYDLNDNIKIHVIGDKSINPYQHILDEISEKSEIFVDTLENEATGSNVNDKIESIKIKYEKSEEYNAFPTLTFKIDGNELIYGDIVFLDITSNGSSSIAFGIVNDKNEKFNLLFKTIYSFYFEIWYKASKD